MPRRKPTSTTQKKAAQKAKRAIKRGDLPPEPKKPVKKNKRRGPPVSDAVHASRKLQSTFEALPSDFLETTRALATALPLTRPIPSSASSACIVPTNDLDDRRILSCPRRPKWRYDMSKTEVEKNEEGLFRKWLAQTDEAVQEWRDESKALSKDLPNLADDRDATMPRSTTYFERNLEVWRQLWRVTEISEIILVLLDSRVPLLHYPPSLVEYLSDRRVILVLTKVDISGPMRANAWIDYFAVHYPNLKVVQVESYVERELTSLHQGRRQHDPRIPETFRRRLVEAIQAEHTAMLEPPEKIRADPVKLEKWKPRVKRDIDWERVLTAEGDKVGTVVGGPAAPSEDDDHKYLTIGLIGQPNVGKSKSSLLNALFGGHKVRASKTPGKTKHFQTLFWTPDVRIVDCPGLVMPNFVPMELQVLSGILPISRVSAIPSCIYHAAELLPLEQIYHISQPTSDPVVDKRTWREGDRPLNLNTQAKDKPWSAMDILIGYADAKGWQTAKAGRPDTHRAGNAIMRALAEGRVAWAFWPPGTNLTSMDYEEGAGIWIRKDMEDDGASSDDEDSEEAEEEEGSQSLDSGSEASGSEQSQDILGSDAETTGIEVGTGRFGALLDIQGGDSSEEGADG